MSSKTPFRNCRIVLSLGCILCGISAASYLAAQFSPRCNSVDQTTVAGIPNVESPATKPESLLSVVVASRVARSEWRGASEAFEVTEPEAEASEALELEAVVFEAVKPDAVAFDAAAPEASAFKFVEPKAVAFDSGEPEVASPEAVVFDSVEPDAVEPDAAAFDDVEPENAAFEAAAFDAVEPEAAAPIAAAPEAVELDAADSASPLSIEFSDKAFANQESNDALNITAQIDDQFHANPVSQFIDPVAQVAPSVPVPVPVQLPAWPDVSTLAVPSSQSAKRTTDPPFMNGRSQRVPPPPPQVANEPLGTEKIGAMQPISRMQPVSRATQVSEKHPIQSDCKKCTDAKQAGNPKYGIHSVSPTQALRRIKSALSH